jgi:chemosensory pili system protein ChpC
MSEQQYSYEESIASDTSRPKAMECMLIPIKAKTLVVPSVSVAEMAMVAPIFPDNSGPDWFLGYYSWRNGRVPLVSFEKLNGESVAGINPNGRIAVFNSTGVDEDVPFIAIPTQGIPRAIEVSQDDILGYNTSSNAYEVMHVRIGMEELVIPDISGIEKAYCTYKSTRRL